MPANSTIPYLPLGTNVIDSNGKLTRPWMIYLQQFQTQAAAAGGPAGPPGPPGTGGSGLVGINH